jgi:hypothetical protein
LLDFNFEVLVFDTTPFLLIFGLTLNLEDEDVLDLDALVAIYLVLVLFSF